MPRAAASFESTGSEPSSACVAVEQAGGAATTAAAALRLQHTVSQPGAARAPPPARARAMRLMPAARRPAVLYPAVAPESARTCSLLARACTLRASVATCPLPFSYSMHVHVCVWSRIVFSLY